MKIFLPAKSALNQRADIDMKAFPPISGWNNKLILAVLLKTTARPGSGQTYNDSLIWEEEKVWIKFLGIQKL